MAKAITFDGETFYPVREAAAILGCDVSRLHAAIRDGRVRTTSRDIPGVMRIAHSEIRRLLDGVPRRPPGEATAERARRKQYERDTATLKAMGW